MTSAQSPHRARAEALLTGSAGTSPWRVPASYFSVDRRPLEAVELGAIERRCELVFGPAAPVGGFNNPRDGRDLRVRRLTVRVGYLVTRRAGDGEAFEGIGNESGPSDPGSVADRAETDAGAIRDAFGWQPNWAALDPVVIDCAPDPDGDPDPIEFEDRVIREVRFVMITCGTLPETLSPTT